MNERAVSCWIPSESGKTFQIECNWETKEECGWIIDVNYDSVLEDGFFCQYNRTDLTISTVPDGSELRRLMFSDIYTKDIAGESEERVSPGMLQLEIRRAGSCDPPTTNWEPITVEIGAIHEGLKCVGGQRIGFGTFAGSAPTELVKPEELDDYPYATFRFNYRPKGILQAMGHIPPPVVERQAPRINNLKRSASVASLRSLSDEEELEELEARAYSIHRAIVGLRDPKRRKHEKSLSRDESEEEKYPPINARKLFPLTTNHEEVIDVESDNE
ncbi:hypothetical protein FRB91_002290 [Serendipita sp. 411]|nr:hypothetical protein FRB91_002290 [Serendipita sp. 411]